MAIRISLRTVCTATLAGIATVVLAGSFLDPSGAALIAPTNPVAPTSVTATLTGSTVTVSWSAPREPDASWFTVTAGEAQRGLVGERSCTGCSSLTWPGLRSGLRYWFGVYAAVSGAQSATTTAAAVTVAADPGCPASTPCVLIDGTNPAGAELHPGSGFVHGITSSTAAGPLDAVAAGTWRVAASTAPTTLQAARATGASVTAVLSDAWWKKTYTTARGGAISPWTEWSTYKAWVTSFVEQAEAAGAAPDYWDIQNEPEAPNYYDPNNKPTRADVLRQYAVAYAAIKAADPKAKVLGPSITWGFDQPTWPVDMRSFIDYAAANRLTFDALTWHEDGDGENIDRRPESIADHVATVQQYLSRYPQLGSPLIMVNEYSGPMYGHRPGWLVSYFASLERANVRGGDLSCWHGQCFTDPGTIDGILTTSEGPTSAFWTFARYAALAGQRLTTSSTDDHVNAVAAADADGTVRVLVGRDDVDPASGGSAPATDVTVLLNVPSGVTTVQVASELLSDDPSITAPQPLPSQTVPVSNGRAAIVIPALAHSAAATLTVTPGS